MAAFFARAVKVRIHRIDVVADRASGAHNGCMDKGTIPRRIGFIVFPEVTALDFVGPMEAFAAARTGAEKRYCYELVTIGINRKRVRSECGLELRAGYTLRTAPALDTVLIP